MNYSIAIDGGSSMHRTREYLVNAVLIVGCFLAPVVVAQDQPSTGVIFENVRIFNGTADRLSGPSNVLTVGNIIRTISSTPIADPPNMKVQRVRGDGRDEGTIAGTRIYPSGAIITITSGHGDFRQPFEVPRVLGAPQTRGELLGAAMIADSRVVETAHTFALTSRRATHAFEGTALWRRTASPHCTDAATFPTTLDAPRQET
jgi:hypothetical protein